MVAAACAVIACDVSGMTARTAMPIQDLSEIDEISTTADGVTTLTLVVEDWEPEALRLAQVAIKVGEAQRYGQRRHPYRLVVVSLVEAPEAAVALVERAGAEMERERERAGVFRVTADGELDWAAIHAANAAQFARQHDLPGTVESLRRVDELLGASFA